MATKTAFNNLFIERCTRIVQLHGILTERRTSKSPLAHEADIPSLPFTLGEDAVKHTNRVAQDLIFAAASFIIATQDAEEMSWHELSENISEIWDIVPEDCVAEGQPARGIILEEIRELCQTIIDATAQAVEICERQPKHRNVPEASPEPRTPRRSTKLAPDQPDLPRPPDSALTWMKRDIPENVPVVSTEPETPQEEMREEFQHTGNQGYPLNISDLTRKVERPTIQREPLDEEIQPYISNVGGEARVNLLRVLVEVSDEIQVLACLGREEIRRADDLLGHLVIAVFDDSDPHDATPQELANLFAETCEVANLTIHVGEFGGKANFEIKWDPLTKVVIDKLNGLEMRMQATDGRSLTEDEYVTLALDLALLSCRHVENYLGDRVMEFARELHTQLKHDQLHRFDYSYPDFLEILKSNRGDFDFYGSPAPAAQSAVRSGFDAR